VALSQEQVIQAAIGLLDEVGLDGLSLRRLAEKLGVRAPALYWHVENKQQLLDLMAEAMWRAEVPRARRLREGETWRDWLGERARALRAALQRHRDGARLAATTKPVGSMWSEIELQIEVLVEVGFAPVDGLRGMFALSNYVSGFALEEEADRGRPPSSTEELTRRLAENPWLRRALLDAGDPQGDAAFEHGLGLILDGMGATLSRTA
jgi:TetR/AcrR family transcriptional regulator, tetracycline repressor protein